MGAALPEKPLRLRMGSCHGLYFLDLLLTNGVTWSVNLWMGSIILSGIIGLLLSYLLVPPITGAEVPSRPESNEHQTSEQTSEETFAAHE